MLISEVYFDGSIKERMVAELLRLPESIRPVMYSDDEEKKSNTQLITDVNRFRFFRERNPLGYFLRGNGVLFDLTLRGNYCSIYTEFEKVEELNMLPEYLQHLSRAGITFGFVCENSEYLHRNRHYFEIGENKIESWVGRDLTKYIPGLYWCTYVSWPMAKLHRLNVEGITTAAESRLRSDDGLLIKFFLHPHEWELNMERLDDLCASLSGVFSILEVKKHVPTQASYAELTSFLSKWQ